MSSLALLPGVLPGGVSPSSTLLPVDLKEPRIVTFSDRVSTFLPSWNVTTAYAERFGYSTELRTVTTLPASTFGGSPWTDAWEKIAQVRDALLAGHSAVMWIDDDAFVNKAVSIESWLGGLQPDEDLLMGHNHAVAGDGGLVLNTGVFIVKNTNWTRTFFSTFLNQCTEEEKTKIDCCPEQAPPQTAAQSNLRSTRCPDGARRTADATLPNPSLAAASDVGGHISTHCSPPPCPTPSDFDLAAPFLSQDCMARLFAAEQTRLKVALVSLDYFNCHPSHAAYVSVCDPWVLHAMGTGDKEHLVPLAKLRQQTGRALTRHEIYSEEGVVEPTSLVAPRSDTSLQSQALLDGRLLDITK